MSEENKTGVNQPAKGIGSLLVEHKIITQAQLDEALKVKKEKKGRITLHLKQLGFLTDKVLDEFLNKVHGIRPRTRHYHSIGKSKEGKEVNGSLLATVSTIMRPDGNLAVAISRVNLACGDVPYRNVGVDKSLARLNRFLRELNNENLSEHQKQKIAEDKASKKVFVMGQDEFKKEFLDRNPFLDPLCPYGRDVNRLLAAQDFLDLVRKLTNRARALDAKNKIVDADILARIKEHLDSVEANGGFE